MRSLLSVKLILFFVFLLQSIHWVLQLHQTGLSNNNNNSNISEPMVVSYNGSVGDYPIITSHIMTATTESVLDSVLVTGLVKNEPEDLTGQRHRWRDPPPIRSLIKIFVTNVSIIIFQTRIRYHVGCRSDGQEAAGRRSGQDQHGPRDLAWRGQSHHPQQ